MFLIKQTWIYVGVVIHSFNNMFKESAGHILHIAGANSIQLLAHPFSPAYDLTGSIIIHHPFIHRQ